LNNQHFHSGLCILWKTRPSFTRRRAGEEASLPGSFAT